MTNTMRLRAILIVLGTVAASVLTMSASVAEQPPPPPPPITPPSGPGDGPAKNLTWRNCTIVSGPEYIGGVCAGSKSKGRTVKEILGKDPVPVCWDDRVSDEDLAAMGKANVPGPDGITFYWRSCLSGVDPETKKVEPGGMHIKTFLTHLGNGTPPETLTDNQRELVDGVADRGNIPTPVAVVSPSDHPRVGLDVAFLNGSKGTLDVNPLGAYIHAYVDHTTIEPLGQDVPPKVGCRRNGTPASRGQTRVEGDGLCWYKYLHSSAGQAEDKYQVRIISHWVVEISPSGKAGTYEPLDEFTKSAITPVPVTEVQALVVQ